MSKTYIATASTTVRAPAARVWEAITNPELIKKYFFGTDVVSDWKAGSPILYRGEWQGKPFEDKGQILEIVPEKLLVSTHWSPMSGVRTSLKIITRSHTAWRKRMEKRK